MKVKAKTPGDAAMTQVNEFGPLEWLYSVG